MAQECKACDMPLIIGLTAELLFDIGEVVGVECLECGCINASHSEIEYDDETTDYEDIANPHKGDAQWGWRNRH